jgi:hypothetical protein
VDFDFFALGEVDLDFFALGEVDLDFFALGEVDFDFFALVGEGVVDLVGAVDFVGAVDLVGAVGVVDLVGAVRVVGVEFDGGDGGVGPLNGGADVLGRFVVVLPGPVGTVLVAEGDLGIPDDGAVVGVREVVLVGAGLGLLPLGAGAWKISWAGSCNRAGSAPAAAATASPVTATKAVAAATPTRVVKRVARRSAGAGRSSRTASRSAAARNCCRASAS